MLRKRLLLLLIFSAFLAQFASSQNSSGKSSYFMYVGTYTGAESKGIYAFRFDPASGKSAPLGLAAESANPSFLAIDVAGRFVYAVNEVGNFGGAQSGGVSAFAIDRKTGKLTILNEIPSRGAGPCHLSLDKTGKYVLVANYDGGSIAVFPVLPDGRLGASTAFVQHNGHGPNAERQQAPHAHEIQVTADNRFAIVADLGLDQLLVYRLDASKGTLEPNAPPFAFVETSAGVRHFVFHPDGKHVFALNEMGGSITGFSFDSAKGVLRNQQLISTLPPNFKGKNESAEIAVSADGRFLYASNRGPDDIAVFAIDSTSGILKLIEHVPTKGKTPRNFAIDPSGQWLLVANQDSNNIAVFRIDPKTGKLGDTGQMINAPSPVSIVFAASE